MVLNNDFNFATSTIKIIAFLIALTLLVLSKYAFIFFAAAMLPTLVSVFFDRNNHKCASATICTFNFIGVIPYLTQLWSSSSIHTVAKYIIASFDTWVVIYGSAFIGQLLYIVIPLVIIKIRIAYNQTQINNLENKVKALNEEWGMKDDPQID